MIMRAEHARKIAKKMYEMRAERARNLCFKLRFGKRIFSFDWLRAPRLDLGPLTFVKFVRWELALARAGVTSDRA